MDIYSDNNIKRSSSFFFQSVLMLTIGCEIGAYGKGCSNQCSGHCLDSVTCNPTTGHCDGGCASGYMKPFCNKSMNSTNFYLMHCIDKQNQHLRFIIKD